MRRPLFLLAACLLVGIAGVFWWLNNLRAAEAPFVGIWKVVMLPPEEQVAFWLVRLDEQNGKARATLLATGHADLKDSKVEKFEVTNEAIRLAMRANDEPMSVVAYFPAEKNRPDKLLGMIDLGMQRHMVQLERTDVRELPPDSIVAHSPADEALRKANQIQDEGRREQALEAMAREFPGQPAAFHALIAWIENAAEREATEASVRAKAEEALRTAIGYGREMEIEAALRISQMLARSEKLASLRAHYARRADELVGTADLPIARVSVLRNLARAIGKAAKAEEAKATEERLRKAEEGLIQIAAVTGEKSTGRAVLVELFTGTQCPPCIAADFAFDALTRTFQPSDVVLLQYHVHVPGADALTSPDSETRSDFYDIEGTPAVYVNGSHEPGVAGFLPQAQGGYDRLRQAVLLRMESEPQATLAVAARRNADQIDVTAEVSDLKKTGEDIRLRLVLVEEHVRYLGGNGQRFHHHVVRGFPGGVSGFALKDKASKHTASVNLNDLRKSLDEHLTEVAKRQKFFSPERPMEFKNLRVVAFVQNDKSKEVLQATEASPTGK